ncbi:hypothetical protein G6514_001193 [Epicoccum nigrum]|nr:hypothetical protein G6514_001193 [Epicoccum nigrum]
MAKNKVHKMRSNTCRLLLLPKKVRQRIWKYALTTPSTELVLRIEQGRLDNNLDAPPVYKRDHTPSKQYVCFPPFVKTTLEPRSNRPISVSILQTNRLIYEEALPILYRSVTFAPTSMFGDFLDTLSAFAKSHIRKIRLQIDYLASSESQGFGWTIICAQTATLPRLKEVRLERNPIMPALCSRDLEKVLRPLLKIKAPKRLTQEGDHDSLQKVLDEIRESKAHGPDSIAVEIVEVDKVQAPTQVPTLSAALQRAIADNLHVRKDSDQAALGEEDWDMWSEASKASHSDDAQDGFSTAAVEITSSPDDDMSYLEDKEDWEVVAGSDINDEK